MIKRVFDVIFSLIGIMLLFPVLLICLILASFDTNSSGLFIQERVGKFGKSFNIYKFRTMSVSSNRISGFGAFLRNYKLDEFPQLFNVFQGNMSVVGPRPDLLGYYDKLEGEDRKILQLKPGLTSLAAIKYANEEELLEQQENPLKYNDTVLFPDKIKMNLDYYYHHSFFGDINIICQTVLALFR